MVARRRGRGMARRGRRLQQLNVVPYRQARNVGLGALGVAAVRNAPNVYNAAVGLANRINRWRNRQVGARNMAIRSKRESRMAQKLGAASGGVKRTRMYGRSDRPKTRAKYGRFKKLAVMKALRMSAPVQITTFGGARLYDQTLGTNELPGYFALKNTIASNATSAVMPVMVLSLNGMIQNGVSPSPFRNVTVDSTGRVIFTVIPGQDKTDAAGALTVNSWQVESTNSGADYNGEFAKVVNEWMAVKLCMYGATNQATTFYVDLVQLLHDYGAPEDEEDLNTSSGTHANRYKSMIYGWWQNKIRPLVTNDVARRLNPSKHGQNNNGVFRTLKRWSYAISPKQSTDKDETPNSVVANLFINDHRCLNYQWQPAEDIYKSDRTSASVGADDFIALPQFQQRQYRIAGGGNVPLDNPMPKARRYLIISALNTTKIGTDVSTIADTPSFDMMVRRCQLVGTAATS